MALTCKSSPVLGRAWRPSRRSADIASSPCSKHHPAIATMIACLVEAPCTALHSDAERDASACSFHFSTGPRPKMAKPIQDVTPFVQWMSLTKLIFYPLGIGFIYTHVSSDARKHKQHTSNSIMAPSQRRGGDPYAKRMSRLASRR